MAITKERLVSLLNAAEYIRTQFLFLADDISRSSKRLVTTPLSDEQKQIVNDILLLCTSVEVDIREQTELLIREQVYWRIQFRPAERAKKRAARRRAGIPSATTTNEPDLAAIWATNKRATNGQALGLKLAPAPEPPPPIYQPSEVERDPPSWEELASIETSAEVEDIDPIPESRADRAHQGLDDPDQSYDLASDQATAASTPPDHTLIASYNHSLEGSPIQFQCSCDDFVAWYPTLTAAQEHLKAPADAST